MSTWSFGSCYKPVVKANTLILPILPINFEIEFPKASAKFSEIICKFQILPGGNILTSKFRKINFLRKQNKIKFQLNPVWPIRSVSWNNWIFVSLAAQQSTVHKMKINHLAYVSHYNKSIFVVTLECLASLKFTVVNVSTSVLPN